MSIDEEAYFNAEFVDIVTSEEWDFPIPYWNEYEEVAIPIQNSYFLIFPTVLEALDEFIKNLKKGNDDNGNDFTGV